MINSWVHPAAAGASTCRMAALGVRISKLAVVWDQDLSVATEQPQPIHLFAALVQEQEAQLL